MPTLLTKLQQAKNSDKDIQTLINAYIDKSGSDPHYSVHQGLLLWKHIIVVLAGYELIKSILTEFHSSVIGGHA